jgi:hypothetical protein
MDLDTLITAFDLPASCRVDQRVPKKMLVEHGAPTAADRRLINEAIEAVEWVAALKPNTIGVAPYRDEVREYLEIALLTVALREERATAAQQTRLIQLIHRAVPYPVLLIAVAAPKLSLSLAHKRWAQNESGKIVLDGEVVRVSLPDDAPSDDALQRFLAALAISRRPGAHLQALYQGWMDTLTALAAARLTGRFALAQGAEQAAARRQALAQCQQLEAEAAHLRAQAKKEKQLARQVELNLRLKRVEAQLAACRQQL